MCTCSKQTLKNINEDSRTSRLFEQTFFKKFKHKRSRHFFIMKKTVKVSIASVSFPCAFLADWETNVYTEPIFKVHSAAPAWLGQAGWDHRISLKKIVENVSWNKSMLNSRFYWLVAFHYLEVRKIPRSKRSSKSRRIMEMPRQGHDT